MLTQAQVYRMISAFPDTFIFAPKHKDPVVDMWTACLIQGVFYAASGNEEDLSWFFDDRMHIGSFRWICAMVFDDSYYLRLRNEFPRFQSRLSNPRTRPRMRSQNVVSGRPCGVRSKK